MDATAAEILKLHRNGKVKIISKKKINANNTNLLYTPGINVVINKILEDKKNFKKLTNSGNTIAIITNATAVLGIGDIEIEASKPVMEGKCLFYHLFKLNAIDILVDQKNNLDDFIHTVKNIYKNFAGIHLEDIKSPDCFYIEKKLNEILDIPVIHDDQHCTAIAILTQILLSNVHDGNVIIYGAGAAGIATGNLLKLHGFKVFMFDSKGLIHKNRIDISEFKKPFACNSELSEKQLILNARIVICLSVPNAIDYKIMIPLKNDSLLFALSNPSPDLDVLQLHKHNPFITIFTGYKNDKFIQVNNCNIFPLLMKYLIKYNVKYTNTIGLIFANVLYKFIIERYKNISLNIFDLQKDYKYLLYSINYAVVRHIKNCKPR